MVVVVQSDIGETVQPSWYNGTRYGFFYCVGTAQKVVQRCMVQAVYWAKVVNVHDADCLYSKDRAEYTWYRLYRVQMCETQGVSCLDGRYTDLQIRQYRGTR